MSGRRRLLGVSSSSLRAWAAAGRVPHVRTPGGHRRFELDELVRWLAERGGAPPAPQHRLQELVPTRLEAMPETAEALAAAADEVLAAFEDELARTRPGGAAAVGRAPDARVLGAPSSRSPTPSTPATWPAATATPSGRASATAPPGSPATRRSPRRWPCAGRWTACSAPRSWTARTELRAVERSLDRMAVRVAAGYADGVRCRLRSTLE